MAGMVGFALPWWEGRAGEGAPGIRVPLFGLIGFIAATIFLFLLAAGLPRPAAFLGLVSLGAGPVGFALAPVGAPVLGAHLAVGWFLSVFALGLSTHFAFAAVEEDPSDDGPRGHRENNEAPAPLP